MKLYLLPAIALLLATVWQASAQPLFHYVNRADPAMRWRKVAESRTPAGTTITELMMTSQVWEGRRWVHEVKIIAPAKMKTPQTAVLLINGGTLAEPEQSYLCTLAEKAGGPVVYLGDIPNQPLFGDLSEDALIAYTFKQCLDTGDPDWPLLFPMVKAAVRCMDCVQQYTAQFWPEGVRHFVVTGASKRGWTTWLTAEAAPDRVVGIVPIVYDNLNLPAQMKHQLDCYGKYSSEIEDYTALGLPDLLQTKQGREFAATVDPYTYRDRATMPKLIINGTNDPYWVLDSTNLYWHGLPNPKYLMYVPNAGHSLGDLSRVSSGEVAFYLCCTGQAAFPRLRWEFHNTHPMSLTLTSNVKPKSVLQWTTSSDTRDFRQATWTSQPLQLKHWKYVCHLAAPAKGYAATYVEAVYDIDGNDLSLCTNVRIVGAKK